MDALSKSRLLSFRQCPKRLWLEMHRPELSIAGGGTEAAFATGNQVGAVARRIYDPDGIGTTLEYDKLGVQGILAATRELLPKRRPIFEAGFQTGRGTSAVRSFADALLPTKRRWSMVEVKSSTSIKDYHLDDIAIQYHVAVGAGLKLRSVHLARVDSAWTYPGGGDYRGLLVEEDMTRHCREHAVQVPSWVRAAHKVVRDARPPETGTGQHCSSPFDCGFHAHCSSEEDARLGAAQHPIQWLPDVRSKALVSHIEQGGVRSLRDVPDELLNVRQLRVKRHTLSGKPFFDAKAAARALSSARLPALFLDFETISFAVPIWAQTRPYEKIPFQFSLHRLGSRGAVGHTGFLDLSGSDPAERIAGALVASCGSTELVFAYNKGFESSCLKYLAARFPRLARRLLAIECRLVDLLPVTRECYYHPDQQGSWSIKSVLPTVAPELRYDALGEVQDGGAAQRAFEEAIHPETPSSRHDELREHLHRYCRLDTWAMVVLWADLTGRKKLVVGGDLAASQPA
jgi:hypothetical protein